MRRITIVLSLGIVAGASAWLLLREGGPSREAVHGSAPLRDQAVEPAVTLPQAPQPSQPEYSPAAATQAPRDSTPAQRQRVRLQQLLASVQSRRARAVHEGAPAATQQALAQHEARLTRRIAANGS